MHEVTMSNFEDTITANDTVIVDFWAPWCAPCQAFKPVFAEAAERHPDVTFATCNTEDEQELGAALQIRSIPTVMVFRENVLVFAQPGMLTAEMLDELLGKVADLDMEEVHREVEAQRASAEATA